MGPGLELAGDDGCAGIATATPLPLQCADGVCSVEVSGICLQENRPAPETGTAYKAVPGAAITLASRHGKGQSVAVADQVEIVSLRSFSAVSVRMPEPLVRDLVGDPADATFGQSPETAQRIAYALGRCAVKVRYQMYPHLRACLGNQHDLYNAVTTQSVWKALQPGS